MPKDISSENLSPIKGMTITGKGLFFDIAFFIGIFILLLHLYLCYKLYAIDQALHSPDSICLNQCKKGLLFIIRIFLLILFCLYFSLPVERTSSLIYESINFLISAHHVAT